MKREDLAALNIPDETISAILELHETGLKAAVEEVNQQHAEENFNRLLDAVISQSKARNAAAVKALLDLDALKSSEDHLTSVRQAVNDLKARESYLFEPEFTPPPLYAAGTGSASIYFSETKGLEAAFRDGIGVNSQKGEWG